MVKVREIMETSFKRFHAGTAALRALDPAAGHCRPLPEIPGHAQASLDQSLVGSWFLSPVSPGAHMVLFVPSKSPFPQSCVSSGSSMVQLMVTSSKRAYAIPRSAAHRVPAPATVHCSPVPPQETLKHRSVSVTVGSLGPGVHKVFLSPLSISGRYGV